MKRSIQIIIFSLFVAFLLTSCFNRNSTIEFDNLKIDEKVYLFPTNDTTKPYAKVEIDYTYPKKFNSKKDLIRLQEIFNGTFFSNRAFSNYSPKEALNTYLNNYSEEYRELGNQYYDDMSNIQDESQPSWYWYQLNLSNEILYEDKNILSYSVNNATYTGGAHGSLNALYYTIDLNNLTTVTEEVIFTPDNYFQILTKAIVDNLMKKYGAHSEEDLLNEGFFNIEDIAPNNNFWLDNEGVHYVFNQYEIAPYAMGPIEVTIPYKEIESIIIPESIAGKQLVELY